jgi:hypothetical protein
MDRRRPRPHNRNPRSPQDFGPLPFDEEDGGATRDVFGNREVVVLDREYPRAAAKNL